MSFINANIPPIGCYIRKQYLFNQEEHHGEFEEGVLFGVTSLMNRTLLFNFMTKGDWEVKGDYFYDIETNEENKDI